MTSKNFKQIIN